MIGNVMEWCGDYYGSYSGNLMDGVLSWLGRETPDSRIDPTRPASGTLRVRRGGSFGTGMMGCRSSFRSAAKDSYADYSLGLRLVFIPENGRARIEW